MKSLLLKLIIPLTILSFAFLTKWSLVDIDSLNAKDVVMYGFPLPFLCEGWHTSMSLQVFVFEFLFDLMVYFLFWLVTIWTINSYLILIRIHWLVGVMLQLMAGIVVFMTCLILTMPEHIYYWQRPYEVEIVEGGISFFFSK